MSNHLDEYIANTDRIYAKEKELINKCLDAHRNKKKLIKKRIKNNFAMEFMIKLSVCAVIFIVIVVVGIVL